MPVTRVHLRFRRWLATFCCLFALLSSGCSSDSELPSGENTEQAGENTARASENIEQSGENMADSGEQPEQPGNATDKVPSGPRVICIRDNKEFEFDSTVDTDPKTFVATVAAACSSKKKEIEETDPVAANAYELERVDQRRQFELQIEVEGSTTVGLLMDVVHKLRFTGFDKFTLLDGESRVPVPGHSHAVGPDLEVIVLELIAEEDGSPCGAKITLGEDTSFVETSGIDFIIKSLERQIKKLEPAQDASRREVEIEIVPAAQMSAVRYFKFCAALQKLIEKRASSSKLTIEQYPLGHPRVSLEMEEVMEELSVEQGSDLLPDAKQQKELSEFDLDGVPDE